MAKKTKSYNNKVLVNKDIRTPYDVMDYSSSMY